MRQTKPASRQFSGRTLSICICPLPHVTAHVRRPVWNVAVPSEAAPVVMEGGAAVLAEKHLTES